MIRPALFLWTVFFWFGACCAQETKTASWQGLLKAGKCQEARALCSPWMFSKDASKLGKGINALPMSLSVGVTRW